MINFINLEKFIKKKYGNCNVQTVDLFLNSLQNNELKEKIIKDNEKELDRLCTWWFNNHEDVTFAIFQDRVVVDPAGFFITKNGKTKFRENYKC